VVALSTSKFDLKKIRRENDWTQQEFADKLGVSRSYIATIETGRQDISINVLHSMIQKLGVRYEDIYAE